MRITLTASRTKQELLRAQLDVARQSSRLTKLLNSFGDDSTDEIVEAVTSARDGIRLARLEETRLREVLIVEEHGASLTDLRGAISELRSFDTSTPVPSIFVSRARIAHAAKAAGFTATFYEHQRRAELRCCGFEKTVWFSCVPERVYPTRDLLGRYVRQTGSLALSGEGPGL